jgi:hypothetical protein
MKPIKIECPSCQQHIEIVPPGPSAIRRVMFFVLTLILGGVLTVGGVYAWVALRLTRSTFSYSEAKAVPAKIPIEGALGWTLGAKLPPQKMEYPDDYGITFISDDMSDPIFKMPQIRALQDRRIYEIRMMADRKQSDIVTDALRAKYGNGQST